MKKQSVMDLEAAICLIENGFNEKAAVILKDLFKYLVKEEYSWKPMDSHPEENKNVPIMYMANDDANPSIYFGMWNGEKWMMRKPYTKDEFEDVPDRFVLLGWYE